MRTSKCKEAQLWISRKIDGEPLPGSTAERVDAHLSACGPCRRFLEIESARSAALRAMLASGGESFARLSATLIREAPTVFRGGVVFRDGAVFPGGAAPGPLREPRLGPRFLRRRLELGVAALLVISAGLWLLLAPTRPVPNIEPHVDPHSPGAQESVLPVSFVVEETVEGSSLLPGRDGSPFRQDISRVRQFIFPLSAPADAHREGGGHGVERFDTRHVKMASWPYH